MKTYFLMILMTLTCIVFAACKDKQMYLHTPDGQVTPVKASECDTYIKNAAAMGVLARCSEQPF